MKIRHAAYALLGLGALSLLYGLNIDTAPSGLHNFALASYQLKTLIIGGVLFLGGIVLFTLHKLKETSLEAVKQETEWREKKERAADVARSADTRIRRSWRAFRKWWTGPTIQSNSWPWKRVFKPSQLLLRLVIGCLVAYVFAESVRGLYGEIRLADFHIGDPTFESVRARIERLYAFQYEAIFVFYSALAFGFFYVFRRNSVSRLVMQLSFLATSFFALTLAWEMLAISALILATSTYLVSRSVRAIANDNARAEKNPLQGDI